MGKIIEARFEELLPGELGFYPIVLLQIIKQVYSGKYHLPCPARESLSVPNKYVHLDGRHRILYRRMSGKENVSLFVAEDREDVMTRKELPGLKKYRYEENNYFIKSRWEAADALAGTLDVKDYNEYYERLVDNYPFMTSVEKFIEFIKRKNNLEQQRLYNLSGISELDN